MRRLAILLALLLALPLATAKEIPRPSWSVGDEWTYAISLVEGGATIQTGERHVVVAARGPVTYQGATREGITLLTWENMSGDPGAHWTDVLDAQTGALLATESGGERLEAVEPCWDIRYPLAVGQSWTTSCDLGAGGAAETFFSVVGAETLRVPAGTYETLALDALGHAVTRQWFAEAACGKVAEFSQTNDLATYVNLTRVRCASAAVPTPATASPATQTTPTATVTPTASPSATPTASTPADRNVTATYDYTCPQERTRWPNFTQAECDAYDADGDLVETAWERDKGNTNPYAADTDGDGRNDNNDKFGRDPDRESPPAALALVLVTLALVALGLRRKAS